MFPEAGSASAGSKPKMMSSPPSPKSVVAALAAGYPVRAGRLPARYPFRTAPKIVSLPASPRISLPTSVPLSTLARHRRRWPSGPPAPREHAGTLRLDGAGARTNCLDPPASVKFGELRPGFGGRRDKAGASHESADGRQPDHLGRRPARDADALHRHRDRAGGLGRTPAATAQLPEVLRVTTHDLRDIVAKGKSTISPACRSDVAFLCQGSIRSSGCCPRLDPSLLDPPAHLLARCSFPVISVLRADRPAGGGRAL